VIGLSKADAEVIMQETIDRAERDNANYTIPIHIRVLCEKNDPNEDIFISFKKSYIRIKWTAKVVGIKAENNESIAPSIYKPVPINDNTIISLMKRRFISSGVEDTLVVNTLDILNMIKGE